LRLPVHVSGGCAWLDNVMSAAPDWLNPAFSGLHCCAVDTTLVILVGWLDWWSCQLLVPMLGVTCPPFSPLEVSCSGDERKILCVQAYDAEKFALHQFVSWKAPMHGNFNFVGCCWEVASRLSWLPKEIKEEVLPNPFPASPSLV